MTKQLRDLEAHATPRPWTAWYDPAQVEFGNADERFNVPTGDDATLIVAMRNALPALLDAVEALRRIANTQDSLDGHGAGGEADFAAEVLARIEGVTEA